MDKIDIINDCIKRIKEERKNHEHLCTWFKDEYKLRIQYLERMKLKLLSQKKDLFS